MSLVQRNVYFAGTAVMTRHDGLRPEKYIVAIVMRELQQSSCKQVGCEKELGGEMSRCHAHNLVIYGTEEGDASLIKDILAKEQRILQITDENH